MAASGDIRIKYLKSGKFQFQLFLTTLGVMGSSTLCDIIVIKRDIHRKIFVVVSIHIAVQTSKHLN